MENKKKIIMVVLSVLVCVMAVGYAVLSTQLNINGTASIDSTWRVEITNITERDKVGDATSKVAPSYTATTANFSVGLIQPGDSITYDIEISNLGTLDARVGSINVTLDENDAIIYKTTGVKAGDSLKVNEKDTLSVTVAYDSSVTSQPADTNKELSVTINYVQDLGENTPITYDTYAIGDVVSFAGSNWYVIKNSSSEEDYVTLMKDKILTNNELGEYGIDYVCSEKNVTYATYGCTTEGQVIEMNTMPFYWSDTCHLSGVYGYTTSADSSSGCRGYNSYGGSKIRDFLQGTYINTLGSENLKSIDGLKIRLISMDELQQNLGYSLTPASAAGFYYKDGVTPEWVYENYGEDSIGVEGYWTMTSSTDNSSRAYHNGSYLAEYNSYIYKINYGVRPVINLLKSSI